MIEVLTKKQGTYLDFKAVHMSLSTVLHQKLTPSDIGVLVKVDAYCDAFQAKPEKEVISSVWGESFWEQYQKAVEKLQKIEQE